MLIQEVETDLPTDEVLARAREFFSLRFTPYAGFPEDESETHLRMRFEAGDLTIGVGRKGDRTVVRGSSSRLHHEVSQFLTTLAAPEEVRQNTTGPGTAGAG